MRKRAVTTLALATLLALVLTGHAATSRAQDVINVRNLSVGCNMVTATFPTGTPASALADAMSPPTALQAVWRVDNATHSFQAFMPQAPQASDLTSLNLLDPLFVCVGAAATISLPVPDLDPESPPISVSLSTGCNAVGLTFSDPEGVVPSDVAAAVTPAGALQSIWRLDNVTHTFQAYVAAAPQASDLTSLQFLDAVFVCTGGPATLSMPAVTEPAGRAVQPPPPAGTGEEAVRYIMEGAVPQAVDLPQGFVALGEDFMSLDGSPGMPPGGLYSYVIVYGNVALIDYSPQTLFSAIFQVALFDTVSHAKSFMSGMTSMSAEELQEELEPVYGGSFGLEIGSLTIQEVEPLAGVGDEASFLRVRIQVKPVGQTTMFVPIAQDVYVIRRDRVVGEVSAVWTPGPPGQQFITENLAKKLDAGIQAALPQLQAAVP